MQSILLDTPGTHVRDSHTAKSDPTINPICGRAASCPKQAAALRRKYMRKQSLDHADRPDKTVQRGEGTPAQSTPSRPSLSLRGNEGLMSQAVHGLVSQAVHGLVSQAVHGLVSLVKLQ